MSPARVLAGTHAGYYVATGVWPIVHRKSFERVTGRKRDFWLVRVLGGLVALIGVTLGIAVVRGRRSPEIQAAAAGSAVLFGIADIWAGRNQSRVYFADLVPEALFTPAWFLPWTSRGTP
jgi:hypothetical protein